MKIKFQDSGNVLWHRRSHAIMKINFAIMNYAIMKINFAIMKFNFALMKN